MIYGNIPTEYNAPYVDIPYYFGTFPFKELIYMKVICIISQS